MQKIKRPWIIVWSALIISLSPSIVVYWLIFKLGFDLEWLALMLVMIGLSMGVEIVSQMEGKPYLWGNTKGIYNKIKVVSIIIVSNIVVFLPLQQDFSNEHIGLWYLISIVSFIIINVFLFILRKLI